MKKLFVLFALMNVFGPFIYAQNLTGNWTLKLTFTDYSQGIKGATNTASSIIQIENTLSNSNDFVGKFIHQGETYGYVNGRIIKATSPYKRDVIIIERVDISRNYFAVYSGHINNGKIENGHFLDTFGNSGSFTMLKE